jgi:hypothetical protein
MRGWIWSERERRENLFIHFGACLLRLYPNLYAAVVLDYNLSFHESRAS